MFHIPIKLRKQTEYCVPKGPSFKRAQSICFSLGGTEVRLRAPRHSSSFAHKEAIQPKTKYNFDSIIMRPCLNDEDRWQGCGLFSRGWGFYGPWFTGALAELHVYMSLITPNHPKEGISFFNPRVFEHYVADFISYKYGKDLYHGHQEWVAPVNWRPVESLPSVAATFYVMPDQVVVNAGDVYRYFFFPVTSNHLVHVHFSLRQRMGGLLIERDKLVDRSSMDQLATDIINSVQITLSPEAKAQQTKALEGLNDTALTNHFPPLKWTTPEQDAQWEREKWQLGIE